MTAGSKFDLHIIGLFGINMIIMIAPEFKSGLDCNVLVLNRYYMAVRVVNARRAFSLLYRKLADVVQEEDGIYSNYNFTDWCEVSEFKHRFEPAEHDWVSTVNFYIAVPRVIRLLFYDLMPRHKVTFNRRNIYARDKNHCQYCGKKFSTNELSLDHVIPRSIGGKSVWKNIVCACLKCNVKKGGQTPKQARMTLIKPPVKPKHNPLIHLHLGHQRYSSWKQFLDDAYWSVELK